MSVESFLEQPGKRMRANRLLPTIVQFERFQTETDEIETYQRSLTYRTEPEVWLTANGINLHDRIAKKAAERYDLRRERKWWGEYHIGTLHKSKPQLVQSASTTARQLFWTDTWHHDFQWDNQGMPGSRNEIVLNTFKRVVDNPVENQVQEVAALLYDPWRSDSQRLVLNGPDGWHAPSDAEAVRAASMVYIMGYIAIGEVNR